MATQVLVPPLGQTVDSVTLVAWHKGEGDTVERGEMLFAIETDKATLDVEAPASGVLRQVTAEPGDEVQVLNAIALIAEPGEAVEHRQVEKEAEGAMPSTAPDRSRVQPRKTGERIFVSPRARRLAEEHNIALTVLKPTGPEGAIVERDVRAYLDAQAAVKISPTAYPAQSVSGGQVPGNERVGALDEGELGDEEVLESIPVIGVWALTAERMARSSRTAAPVTLNSEADATSLVDLRHDLASDGLETSYNALLLYILGRALGDHPRLNASLAGDTIRVWRRIHIGLAVDTDRGLLVPVVRDVERKGLAQLAEESQALAERARAGTCRPEELGGGTFTLTNLGKFGIDSFTPIINLPECAILGVGRIKTQSAFSGDQVVARRKMWLSLSFDHRLVDGAPAARFLQRVVQLIERPHLLLI
jgi:pyruvate dehydrogenase E2 component (dihydrolipoamide acetyltransferase)